MKRLVFIWGYWGPYHYARLRGAREAANGSGFSVHGLELFRRSGIYDYRAQEEAGEVVHLDVGAHEMGFYPANMLRQAVPALLRLKPDVVFAPSYWHWSLMLNLSARLRGARVVMMNETHGGTERATGARRWLKRQIVRRFHAGLVGGEPHRRYFAGLGLPADRIFPGYDVVDNGYFRERADEARAGAAAVRERLGLPPDYILSLGRMVPKKNLPRLVTAFARLRQPAGRPVHLVMIGTGETEREIRAAATGAGLPTVEHLRAEGGPEPRPDYDPAVPAVHFYGFRQVDENPAFYALARAFVLPSLYEEWGLVVNEAMACATPVVASRTLGSAEDLVLDGSTGLRIDPADTDELAAALQRFVDDADWARRIGEQARDHVAAWGLEHFGRNALRAAAAALAGREEDVAV
jgi:glycosyltransferase involved in cell wall biosynthesis